MGLFTATKSDKAKFKKVKEEGCVLTLSVEIPQEEVASQTQTALVRLQNRARIPGFRAGKAPLDVVKQHFTGHAKEEALDQLIRKHAPVPIAVRVVLEMLEIVHTRTRTQTRTQARAPHGRIRPRHCASR